MNFCVNIIKTSIINNKKGFIIKNNKKNVNLIKALIKINLIKYIKIENKNIIGFLNYNNNKPIFCKITNIFKFSKKNYISLKNLKKINLKHNWILILSTNKGLLNNFEAVNLNLGGLLIAKIWN